MHNYLINKMNITHIAHPILQQYQLFILYNRQQNMEIQYNRAVHYLGQLILNKDYQRAVHLASEIIQNGFKNNQLLVMQSYAIKMAQGVEKATHFIDIMTNKQNKQENIQINPLISFVKAQYLAELQDYEQSCKHYRELLFEDKTTINNSYNSLSTPISVISQNYCQIISKRPFRVAPMSQKYRKQFSVNLDEDLKKLIQQVNTVTKQYKIQTSRHHIKKQLVKQEYQQKDFLNNRVSEFSQQTVANNKNNQELTINQLSFQEGNNKINSLQMTIQKLKQFMNKYSHIKKKFIKIVYDCEFAALRINRDKSIHQKKSTHQSKQKCLNKTNLAYKSWSKEKLSSHNKLSSHDKLKKNPIKQSNKTLSESQKLNKKGFEIKKILIQINKFIKFISSQVVSKQTILEKYQQNNKQTIKNSFQEQKNQLNEF